MKKSVFFYIKFVFETRVCSFFSLERRVIVDSGYSLMRGWEQRAVCRSYTLTLRFQSCIWPRLRQGRTPTGWNLSDSLKELWERERNLIFCHSTCQTWSGQQVNVTLFSGDNGLISSHFNLMMSNPVIGTKFWHSTFLQTTNILKLCFSVCSVICSSM